MQESPHDWLKAYIKDVPDFPKAGIVFKDINPLLANKNAFQYSIQRLADLAWKMDAEAIVAMESRGFFFGAPVAFSLGVPLVPVRKKGKLPGETITINYDLEYGSGHLEIPKAGLTPGSNVVIIDDVLATGGTALATQHLVEKSGAHVKGFAFLAELTFLNGKEKLKDIPNWSLVSY